MEESKIRNRVKPNEARSVDKEGEEATHKDPEFAVRESPLTILMNTSAHIRAIYHIFIVILVVLLCDTAIYDLVETGKINLGQHTVAQGFGDVGRAARLWLYLLLVATAFYPMLRIYAAIGSLLTSNLKLRGVWRWVGTGGLCVVHTALVGVPVWQLAAQHLALASSFTVTCEMFRFAMKVQATAAACSERCFSTTTPAPPLPSFGRYFYFLFAPTLLYRDHYPRTKQIRWGVVCYHFAEVIAIIFYNSFLWERFILPYWSDYGKTPSVSAGRVVRGMFACVMPGVLSFLCGFYCILHAWLNAFAEITTFGDRLFYEEWWTSSQFSSYIRLWNRVVHSWLRQHLHRPLAALLPRFAATFAVFVVSAVAHEVVLALSFGFFYPVLMMQFGGFGALLALLPLKVNSPAARNTLNLLLWLGFFIGNGLLWSLYPMEHFSRINCPPSKSDSFFVPKSWSCPQIILKPDWTFQNPFAVLFS